MMVRQILWKMIDIPLVPVLLGASCANLVAIVVLNACIPSGIHCDSSVSSSSVNSIDFCHVEIP